MLLLGPRLCHHRGHLLKTEKIIPSYTAKVVDGVFSRSATPCFGHGNVNPG